MNALPVVGQVVLVVSVEEGVAPVREERHVGVHARAVLAEERLRHEGGVVARLLRDLLHDQPVGDRVVGHVERRGVAHVDLVLRRGDLVVVVLDRDPHRLERLDRVVAELGRRVHRRHREVAALVERDRALVVLEEEVLELRADVEGVEAERLHALERLPEHVARVALVGRAVGLDDVADHPADGAAAVRHQAEGLRIGDRDHVRLLDRVEARDRRAVEAHPVVERRLDLGRGDREALQVPLEVGEPEEDVLDTLVPDLLRGRGPAPPDRTSPGACSRSSPYGGSSFENEKSPGGGEIRVRGNVATKDDRSLHRRRVDSQLRLTAVIADRPAVESERRDERRRRAGDRGPDRRTRCRSRRAQGHRPIRPRTRRRSSSREPSHGRASRPRWRSARSSGPALRATARAARPRRPPARSQTSRQARTRAGRRSAARRRRTASAPSARAPSRRSGVRAAVRPGARAVSRRRRGHRTRPPGRGRRSPARRPRRGTAPPRAGRTPHPRRRGRRRFQRSGAGSAAA